MLQLNFNALCSNNSRYFHTHLIYMTSVIFAEILIFSPTATVIALTFRRKPPVRHGLPVSRVTWSRIQWRVKWTRSRRVNVDKQNIFARLTNVYRVNLEEREGAAGVHFWVRGALQGLYEVRSHTDRPKETLQPRYNMQGYESNFTHQFTN